LVLFLTALSPITGGFFAHNYGFMVAYIAGATGMVLSSIPLIFTINKNSGKKMTYTSALKEIDKKSIFLLLGDGLTWNFHGFLWPVVLFSLVGNYVLFGGLLAFEIILSAILFLSIGNIIDRGRGLTIMKIAFTLNIILLIGRSFYVTTIPEIIFFEVICALTVCFYSPILNTAWYNLAKKSHNTLWFHYFSEIGWDIGAFIALMSAGLWSLMGMEIRYVMPFALIGMVIVWKTLRNYFVQEKRI
jgi:hypothetical protein